MNTTGRSRKKHYVRRYREGLTSAQATKASQSESQKACYCRYKILLVDIIVAGVDIVVLGVDVGLVSGVLVLGVDLGVLVADVLDVGVDIGVLVADVRVLGADIIVLVSGRKSVVLIRRWRGRETRDG